MSADPNWLDARLGPLEVVAIVLPSTGVASAWDTLLTAVDAHLLRVLDLELVRVGDTGVELVKGDDLSNLLPPDLIGASSDLLTSDDVRALSDDLEPGSLTAVLVVEHLTLLNVLSDFANAGSEIIMGGVLAEDELDELLEETES
ncbi:hypothetical protein [Micropruina sp.]|uniref:hypothetical protein n=1 Tax=Micropruina sp. TaxID=2737536 RepID=UPI0039E29865